MVLKPDDIARRSFSPSAEGFHQGEVRDFLARVAADQRTLMAALPEGQREVSELTLAIGNHEQRLHYLEQRLQAAIDRIERVADAIEATTQAQSAPPPAIAAAPPPVTPRESLTEAARPAPAASAPTATEAPAAPAKPAPSAALADPAPPAAPAMAPPAAAAPTPAPVPRPAPAPTPAERVAPPTDVPRDLASVGATSAADGGLQFDILENEPLISEKSNDLLDAVLDDVMGNLNEGTT